MEFKKLLILLFFAAALVFQSCFIGPDGDSENLLGNYYVAGDSGFKNVHLGYEDNEFGGIGLIEDPISAIGYNDEYICVKREFETSEYFIVRVDQSGVYSNAQDAIMGPLSEVKFNVERNKLGLDNLEFTREFAN